VSNQFNSDANCFQVVHNHFNSIAWAFGTIYHNSLIAENYYNNINWCLNSVSDHLCLVNNRFNQMENGLEGAKLYLDRVYDQLEKC